MRGWVWEGGTSFKKSPFPRSSPTSLKPAWTERGGKVLEREWVWERENFFHVSVDSVNKEPTQTFKKSCFRCVMQLR